MVLIKTFSYRWVCYGNILKHCEKEMFIRMNIVIVNTLNRRGIH